ncbi:hypothetical protein K469DRAFT_713512 [Zopfia rhizophila CBS 207.26]|uniref:Protein kinase domain-containing protein n=1 Tax=Zopfia rhizophila CBS 207.26 TaxID=1314779 RepID=A0A6A6D618_9PEZI|nr:hypothetical protein K469DRAFT_704372 [Zopfia rhizophila CBS 207.26]KAF2181448.1 hypothetical protein K469DRAFT_713512 [Zopfia rhizophila CBS 207.26]
MPRPRRAGKSVNVSPSNGEELLPPCNGPKLHPFKGKSLNIDFQSLLNESSSSDSSSEGEGQGFVFKALIDSKPFAIKLFKFFNIEEARALFEDFQNDEMPDDVFVGNVDPFFAECRAYGRIDEFYKKHLGSKDPGLIAAPCYGYIYITKEQEASLRSQFGSLEWNRANSDADKQIRALVKQFIPNEPIDTKVRSIRRMVKDLKTLHSIGVYPRDICARNYRGGLLVDFGMALTEPSCVLNVLPEWIARKERKRDLGAFDEMIQELGIKTLVRAARTVDRQILTRTEYTQYGLRDDFVELDASGRRAKTARV